MHVCATTSDLPLAFWFALPVYMAVGVILWRQWPSLRDVFCEAGYVGGMILAAFIWPFMLAQLAVIGFILSVAWLLGNVFRLLRRKP
jgi:hypothetical protein